MSELRDARTRNAEETILDLQTEVEHLSATITRSQDKIDELSNEVERLRAALETVIPLLIYYSKDLEDQQAILKARAALEQKADTK